MVRGRNTGCAGSQITRGAQGGSAGGIRDNARRCVLLNGLAPAWRSLSNSKLLVPVPISHSRAGRLSSLAWRSANELTPRRYLAPAKQCDSSSNRRRQGSHDDASSGDVDDDSTRLAY